MMGTSLPVMQKKEQLLWETFKSRLGTTELCDMQFNLHAFIQPFANLHSLEADFTDEEIDSVIKSSSKW